MKLDLGEEINLWHTLCNNAHDRLFDEIRGSLASHIYDRLYDDLQDSLWGIFGARLALALAVSLEGRHAT